MYGTTFQCLPTGYAHLCDQLHYVFDNAVTVLIPHDYMYCELF